MPNGVPFNDANLKVAADGFLTFISTGKRVTLKGFKNFIKVIRL